MRGLVEGVVGGTSGIGARTAELLALEAAKVVIAGRRQAEGTALAQQIGPPARFMRCDVLVEPDVQRLVGETCEEFGRIDALINCAGDAGPTGGIADVELASLSASLLTVMREPAGARLVRADIHSHQDRGGVCSLQSTDLCRFLGSGFPASASVGFQQAQPDLADGREARHGVPESVDGDLAGDGHGGRVQ